MKNKGFTLIELLAVIVILAVISLIATPMILNVIETAKKGAAEASAYGYINAIESYAMIESVSGITTDDGIYEVGDIPAPIKGTEPSEGWVSLKDYEVIDCSLKINGYVVDCAGGKAKVTDKESVDANPTQIPTRPLISGGVNNWVQNVVTISVIKESTSPVAIDHYQYYVSTSENTQENGEWIDLSQGINSVEIKEAGRRYIYFRAVTTNGISGLISLPQISLIDELDPTVTISLNGKVATLTLSDNIGVTGYNVTTSNTAPTTWTEIDSVAETTKEWTATSAGTYYAWVKDASGRTESTLFEIPQSLFSYEATIIYSCPSESYTLDESAGTCSIIETKQDESCGTSQVQKKCGYYLGNETKRSDGLCTYSCTLNSSHGTQWVGTCGYLSSGARCEYVTGTTTVINSCPVTTVIDATITYSCPNGGTANSEGICEF